MATFLSCKSMCMNTLHCMMMMWGLMSSDVVCTVSKWTWCLTSTETIRLIRDGEKGRKGVWGWREREIIYLSQHCHTRMTPALRWAVMRAILMFHNCEGQSHKTGSTDHNFWRERRAEADLNRGSSTYQPNALLLGQTGSHQHCIINTAF